jgi:hypothetical protein
MVANSGPGGQWDEVRDQLQQKEGRARLPQQAGRVHESGKKEQYGADWI